MSDDPGRRDVFRLPGFAKFWAAEAVSEFGTYVTTIALQVLVVLTLGGAAFEVGLVNAARFLPYLLLGFVVGALVDRRRRKPVLVSTDLARAVLLCSIPLLWLLGWLSLPTLIAVVIVFGVMSLFNDAATQSYLPRLVPKWALVPANARLGQSSAVAQTTGPLAGGGLVGLIGAPLAVLVDAVTYLVSAVLTATIPLVEPEAERGKPLTLRKDIVEGLRWVYRHPTLAPLSVSAHIWFLANGMGGAIFVPLVLLVLGFGPLELGIMVAVAGGFALDRCIRLGLGGASLGRRPGDHSHQGALPDRLGADAVRGVRCGMVGTRPHRRRAGTDRLRDGRRQPERDGLPPGRHTRCAAGPREHEHALGEPHDDRDRRTARRPPRRSARLSDRDRHRHRDLHRRPPHRPAVAVPHRPPRRRMRSRAVG